MDILEKIIPFVSAAKTPESNWNTILPSQGGGSSGLFTRLFFIDSDTPFRQVVANILYFVLLIAGVLAVIYLVYAGIQYITAGGDADKATSARTGIINAIIGIVIILLALVIVRWVLGIVSSGVA